MITKFINNHKYYNLVYSILVFIKENTFKFYINLRFKVYWTFYRDKLIKDFTKFEKKVYSQNYEDGIIETIFYKIGTTNKYFVEFGVEDGSECLTKNLLVNHGWDGLQMDGTDHGNKFIKNEFITAENINDLFVKYNVPKEFDLLVIDIDGNDYWVWEKIVDYNPRVVIMEYNSKFAPPQCLTIKYNPTHIWDHSDYFGATLSALNNLAITKGYKLIYCDSKGINAFFVKNELVNSENFDIKSEIDLYRKPQYGHKINGIRNGHPEGIKKLINID